MSTQGNGPRVEQVMTPAPVHLDVACTLGGALAFLVRHRYQSVPVNDREGKLLGIVTRAGLLARLCELKDAAARVQDLLETPLRSLLEPPLRVPMGTSLADACKLLVCEEAPAVLIVDEAQVLGILTLQDVARCVAYGGEAAPGLGEGRGHCFSPGGLPETLAPADARERGRVLGLLEQKSRASAS